MSALVGARLLLLLLWAGACLGLARGDLLVSDLVDTQAADSGPRSLQKRSTSDVWVEVHSVKVDCVVTSRFAHTVMTSTALNKANVSKEISFEVDLPKTAFITNFTMEIEGREYVGQVKEKEKAKKQYEKAVSSGQTAGLVKASGRKMEKFSVSVNIAAESNVTFILTYEELLQRKMGSYEIQTRVKPKVPVQEFQIVTTIYEPQGISFVDAQANFLTNDLLPLVEKTVTDKKARISFSPTLEQQRSCPACDTSLIDGDFIIKYDVNRAKSLGDIQIVNGYFVHFFAPQDVSTIPKNVVFVIDRSGSMSGVKMAQTREAMLAILDDLQEDDHFGIVQFDDRVLRWRESLAKATKDNVTEAKTYVRSITDYGGTDINSGVLSGVDLIVNDRKNNKLQERSIDMVILLTDGMPNSGVYQPEAIYRNVREAIGGNMSLHCLGFGDNVDYSFLDVMSKQNKGIARRIYEASDAVVQLQGFFDEVASTLLLDVDMRYPANTEYLTTNHFDQLFNGSEIVVAGRVTDNDLDNFLVEVYGQGLEEDFLVKEQVNVLDWATIYPDEEYIFGDFVERLWAYLTIQQLLDKSKSGTTDEKANSTAKALQMSLDYSFVTPLTSMVVTKPEAEDGPTGPLIADKLTEEQRQAAERLGHNQHVQYHYAAPASPVYLVDGDPHFLIELPERRDALCFNINDNPGTIFNLVKDPELGILINGQTIGDKKVSANSTINTYFWRFGIIHQKYGLKIDVTTRYITVFQNDKRIKLLWSDLGSIKGPNVDLHLAKDRSLTITLRDSVKFVILLHKVWEKHPLHRDYLGFYTVDSHLMSPMVHGLLGQFYRGVQYEVTNLREGEVPEKPDATMFVKGHQLNVTRGWQRDFRRDLKNGESVPCWFVHNNGTGLVDGAAEDYVVSGLFKTR
ncbi:inter-alpha-trypsin inhibitor heavy chain H3-like [Synchiropus splendidus]|uniref:inter-alpha-trypsin inhibitor heavy chain H3-like n=1 Tax=Synchiropus splendidus TaxID=270530 RepID=UPI00237E2363|nr:inter-alpha-trypsin inhibitor heavy chain H3-like [Synchiropus splendidus]